MKDILIVDDDPSVHDILRMYLEREGFDVRSAHDGEGGARQAIDDPPELVILDIMMPDLDGYEVCRRVRAEGDVPIIFLSCRDDDVDPIIGLEVGADDYVTKPFNPREVVARVKAVLRRSASDPQQDQAAIEVGAVRVDPRTREVTVQGAPIKLTPKEFDILCLMAAEPRVVFSRERIMEKVWGYSFDDCDVRTVDTHVKRLRKKLIEGGCQGCTIEAVWGAGYRLVVEE
jgi:DNA-binding response OmpR family regulator